MRFHAVFAAVLVSAAFALPVQAADNTAQQTAMKNCAATWKTMSAGDKAKTKYQDYMGTCMKGAAAGPSMAMTAKPAASMAMTAKPASGSMMMAAPAGGGSAKCKDGKVMTYKTRSGTCSGHGGVASWM
jgi:hypothetical protein